MKEQNNQEEQRKNSKKNMQCAIKKHKAQQVNRKFSQDLEKDKKKSLSREESQKTSE